MRKISCANSEASSPPVPARISSTTFFSSFGSLGSSRILGPPLPRSSRRLSRSASSYTGCGRLFGPALDAGRRIKDEIARETGLAVSLGVASNKLVSHVASRSAKCANLVDVYAGYERSFVAPVPVARFPLVGEKRSPALCELGVARVGDVLLFSEEIFTFCFGSWGRRLYRGALGEDTAPVRTRSGIDERFTVEEILEPDRVEYRFLEGVLYRLAERLGEKLRAERSLAGAVSLDVRYADGLAAKGTGRPGGRGADGAGRAGALDASAASDAPASDDLSIYEAAREIFARVYTRRVRVRSLVLSAGRITPAPLQLELFAGDREAAVERRGKLYAALDRLRAAHPGRAAPAFGRAHVAGLSAIAPRGCSLAERSALPRGPHRRHPLAEVSEPAQRAGTPSASPAPSARRFE